MNRRTPNGGRFLPPAAVNRQNTPALWAEEGGAALAEDRGRVALAKRMLTLAARGPLFLHKIARRHCRKTDKPAWRPACPGTLALRNRSSWPLLSCLRQAVHKGGVAVSPVVTPWSKWADRVAPLQSGARVSTHRWASQRVVRETGCFEFISRTSGTLGVSPWQRHHREPIDRAEMALTRVRESVFVTLSRPTGGRGRFKPVASDSGRVSAAVWRATRFLPGLVGAPPRRPLFAVSRWWARPPLSREGSPLLPPQQKRVAAQRRGEGPWDASLEPVRLGDERPAGVFSGGLSTEA